MLRNHFKHRNRQPVSTQMETDVHWADHKQDACLQYESWARKTEDHLVWLQLGTSSNSNSSLSWACPRMTAQVPHVWIWGLQINFSEWVNPQARSPQIKINSVRIHLRHCSVCRRLFTSNQWSVVRTQWGKPTQFVWDPWQRRSPFYFQSLQRGWQWKLSYSSPFVL